MVRGSIFVVVALLMTGCGSDDGKRYPVSSAGQGQVTLREEEVAPRPAPVRERVIEVPPKGPTTREVELQRTIESLEARQREMNAEIERLKREKAGGAK